MLQSPSILVAIGHSETPELPQQEYSNIFSRYNIQSLKKQSDADFYNEVIKNPQLPEWSQSRFDLYGFMGGQCKYTYDYSIQHIANFFQKHEDIKVVACDTLHSRKLFQHHQYNHPQAAKNIPFFVKEDVLKDINFANQKEPLQDQLQALKKIYTIFHIASPLISMREEGS